MGTDTDVVVIGGGQAGLAVSHELGERGVDHLVLERDRVGSSWAGLWDSFHLNTPTWSVRLPGLSDDGADPEGFLSRAAIVARLERYAAGAPVREGVDVSSLEPAAEGFRMQTSDGPLLTRSVAVCTGAYQRPFRPRGAEGSPADLATLDPRSYSDPGSVPDGTVLVIGAGQSGCQIAVELLDAGRDVVVSCGRAPNVPRRIGDHDVVWWALEIGLLDQTLDELPSPAARLAANVTASGVDGGHDLDARTLRAQGATLVGRFEGCDGEAVRFADDLAEAVAWADDRYVDFRDDVERLCGERGLDVPSLPDPEPFDPTAPRSIDAAALGGVIVTVGFRPDYGWVGVPDAFDEMGFPVQRDGASAVAPGLFFAGVHFLRSRKSSLLVGIGEDAEVVAEGIERHLG